MPKITILPSQTEFQAHDGESILDAAIRNGHNLPHACQSGVCGSCRASLIEGNTQNTGDYDDYVLSDDEREEGSVLLCCQSASSDCVFEMSSYAGNKALPIRTLPVKISDIQHIGDIAILRVALPKAPSFQFHAGQYMDVLLKDGQRSYSIANAPSQNDFLEFHIKHHEGGLFSPLLFNGQMKIGSIMRLRGPLGGFFLNENTQKPLIFIATGTGFAPIKSLLCHLADTDPQRSIHIYHGTRIQAGLYDETALNEILQTLPHAHYTPVLSRPDENWTGATGHVQQHVLQDHPNLSQHEVYACGSATMIHAAFSLLTEKAALPTDAFFSDVFTPST